MATQMLPDRSEPFQNGSLGQLPWYSVPGVSGRPDSHLDLKLTCRLEQIPQLTLVENLNDAYPQYVVFFLVYMLERRNRSCCLFSSSFFIKPNPPHILQTAPSPSPFNNLPGPLQTGQYIIPYLSGLKRLPFSIFSFTIRPQPKDAQGETPRRSTILLSVRGPLFSPNKSE